MIYSHNSTPSEELIERIAEQGFDYLPELIRIMINAAMQAERQKYLGAEPYERSPERRDYANGYKPKTMKTRIGEITFDVPQVREGDFYPEALEKGLRVVTQATGALVSELRYSAYGEQRFASGASPTDYRYTGQLSKVATVGLYHYGARWFDPKSFCLSACMAALIMIRSSSGR